jgi:hypothetical protein
MKVVNYLKEPKMPSKTNQLPKGRQVTTAPHPRRSYLPFLLAGSALLLIVLGSAFLLRPGGPSAATGSPAQVTGQPRLAVDRQQIDFGKVPLDKPIKATFVLSNVGDQPLQILGEPVIEVKQGC